MLTVRTSSTRRLVVVDPISIEAGYPSCFGVFRTYPRQIGTSGQGRFLRRQGSEVWVRKRHLAWLETQYPRRPFVRCTNQPPLRSRLTTMLVGTISKAASVELHEVTGITATHGVSWLTVFPLSAHKTSA